jgi:hypothetical protein
LLGVGEGLLGFGQGGQGSHFFELQVLWFVKRPRSGGIGAEVVRSMFSRLGDLGEDAGEKLEDIESLTLGV